MNVIRLSWKVVANCAYSTVKKSLSSVLYLPESASPIFSFLLLYSLLVHTRCV